MSRQLATFTLAGASYGIDVVRVREAMRGTARTPVPLSAPSIAGLINLRGQVVLTIDLRTRLGLEPLADDLEPMMVVVQVDGEPIGLLVDDVGDLVEVEDEQPQAPPATVRTTVAEVIRGVHTLDQRLLLELDVDRATSDS